MLDDNTTKDLSSDNLLPALLEEREQVKALLDNAERRLKEINSEIRSRIGDACAASLPGWSIKHLTWQRKEYVVPAQQIRQLHIKRVREEEPC